MISRLVNPPERGLVSKFWPREMKLAKELYSLFPNEEFWEKLNFGKTFNSLAALKFENNYKEISLRFKSFSSIEEENTRPQAIVISDRKFGPSVDNQVLQKKQVFLKDIL